MNAHVSFILFSIQVAADLYKKSIFLYMSQRRFGLHSGETAV